MNLPSNIDYVEQVAQALVADVAPEEAPYFDVAAQRFRAAPPASPHPR